MGFIQWNTVFLVQELFITPRILTDDGVKSSRGRKQRSESQTGKFFVALCSELRGSLQRKEDDNTKFVVYVGLTLKRQPQQATVRCKLRIPQLLFEAEYPPHSTYSEQAQSGTSPGGYCMTFPQCETTPSYVNL